MIFATKTREKKMQLMIRKLFFFLFVTASKKPVPLLRSRHNIVSWQNLQKTQTEKKTRTIFQAVSKNEPQIAA